MDARFQMAHLSGLLACCSQQRRDDMGLSVAARRGGGRPFRAEPGRMATRGFDWASNRLAISIAISS